MVISGMENAICLFVSVACFAWRRQLSGLKNAAFYLKGRDHSQVDGRTIRQIRKAVANLHFVETPAWYAQAGIFAPMLYLTARSEGFAWIESIGIAIVLTLCASAIGGPFYQCPINVQEGKACVAKDERKKSEFAWGKIRFWWPRPWYGHRRIVGAAAGAIVWILVLIHFLWS